MQMISFRDDLPSRAGTRILQTLSKHTWKAKKGGKDAALDGALMKVHLSNEGLFDYELGGRGV